MRHPATGSPRPGSEEAGRVGRMIGGRGRATPGSATGLRVDRSCVDSARVIGWRRAGTPPVGAFPRSRSVPAQLATPEKPVRMLVRRPGSAGHGG